MQEKTGIRKEVGIKGEDAAADYLTKYGFRVIARNVRYKMGEIDIVAKRGDELHFVEVRTRKDPLFLSPLETISEVKKKRIRMSAQAFLNDPRYYFKNIESSTCYFSVIGIDLSEEKPSVTCVFDAFI